MNSKERLLIIVGPTASGKSTLAVELAKKFNGEVISADSRQVYKGLDIGTGKVTKSEMRGIPHHLLDVASPRKNFSAGDFVTRARTAYCSVLQNTRIAIMAGGTGFYIDAFVGRIALPQIGPNPVLRAKLQKKTVEELYALLRKKDLKRAKNMDTPSERNNKVRLIRALEIASATKVRPLPDTKVEPLYEVLWIGITPPFAELEKKIALRLKSRIQSGMIAEAKRLHAAGLSYKRMEELGLEYRSLARLLQNKIDREEFEAELQRDIRKYAKRQLAYWKRNKDINWFSPKEKSKIERAVRQWLTK